MKQWKRLWSHFSQFFQRQTSLFLALILGITVSFFAFQSLLGTVNYTIETIARQRYRTYSLDVSSSTMDQDDLATLSSLMGEEVQTVLLMTIDPEQPLVVGFWGTDQTEGDDWCTCLEGGFFTEEEMNGDQHIAVVSEEMYLPADVEWRRRPLVLNDHEYSVVGLGFSSMTTLLFTDGKLMMEYYPPADVVYKEGENDPVDLEHPWKLEYGSAILLPNHAYWQEGYSPDLVRIQAMPSLWGQEERFEQKLRLLFPEAKIIPPGDAGDWLSDAVRQNLIQAAVVTILAVINIIALFTYWLRSNQHTYLVYRICGARRHQLFSTVALQWGIIVTLCFFLARLLQWILKPMADYLHISLALSPVQALSILVGGYVVTMLLMSKTLWNLSGGTRQVLQKGRI